jgi:hypothetical protein
MLLIGEPLEFHMPTYVSLSVINVSVIASLRADARDQEAGIHPSAHPVHDDDPAAEQERTP